MVQPQQAELAPSIAPLEDVTIEEGEGVRFNTVVIGSPMPSVQWYREGALIPHSRDFEVSTGIRITHNTILECTCKATCCMYEHTQATFIRSTLSHMHSVCVLFS